MLSFMLRRTLLRPVIISTAQMLPIRSVLSNQCLALIVSRNLATTTDVRDSEPTTASEPERKSKRKSTRRKTGSSTKTSGNDKGKRAAKRGAKKAETKKKITIRPQDKPPKPPGSAYILWLTEWTHSQPKFDNRETAQSQFKKGAQIWHTVSEYEKQRYREKYDNLRADYKKRIEEWREQVDPHVLRELNRRRVAKGRSRIRGPRTGRPLSGFMRYYQNARNEYPRTEIDQKAYFKAVGKWASSQWKAMNDAERAKYNDPATADFEAWREKRRVEKQAKQ